MGNAGATPAAELKKKYVRNIGLIFLLIVILLTFFSKTINNFLMPEVECRKPVSAYLETGITAKGVIRASDIEKIYAYGSWRVTDVKVKEGAEVARGDVLATVEAEDVMLDMKSKELEMLKLENALEQYRESFDESSRREELDRQSRAAARAQKELDSLKALYESGGETQAALEAAQDRLDAAKQSYEAGLREFDRRKADYDRTLKEKESELELKRLEYKKLLGNMPENGSITAAGDGVVKMVAIEKGSVCASGQVVIELVEKGSPMTAEWSLSPEKADKVEAGDNVTLSIESDDFISINGVVKEKQYSSKDGMYVLTSNIKMENEAENINIRDGQEVEVSMVKRTENYPLVVPNSSIVTQGGKSWVFALRESEGALGNQDYVEMIYVKVEASDDFNSAISGSVTEEDSVVTFSTKPLADGVQVRSR
jgi:HlyD family secretion protein